MTLPSLPPGRLAQARPLSSSIDELSGIDVHTVTLTSSGDDPAALGDMYADAEAIAQAVAAVDGRLLWSLTPMAASPPRKHSRTRETSDASSTWLHSSSRPVSRFYLSTGVRR